MKARISTLLIAAGFAGSAATAAPPPAARNFVSCPIVQDTPTVPCWVTEYDGELYYLGIQTDVSAPFDPPSLGHRVLVEGTVKDGPRICGGIVLEPVNVSWMPELDGSCNEIRPIEGYTVPFAPRPPGPSGGRLAFDPAPGTPRAAPPPLEGPQEFVIYYDYNMLIGGRDAGTLARIFNYARSLPAPRLTITGYRGATLLSDGETLVEPESLAQERAAELRKVLTRAGIDTKSITVKAVDKLEEPDGNDDWRSRRTVVRVEP